VSEQAAGSRPGYFEDFTVGSVYEFGSITVTEPEIIAFARQFDPQAMHTDPVRRRRARPAG
jgi:acyl dehydratase